MDRIMIVTSMSDEMTDLTRAQASSLLKKGTVPLQRATFP
jgi:hypothetical protein